MRGFCLCAALLLLVIAPTSILAAQDTGAKYKYVVKGRVVDDQGKPVPKASLILEPKGWSGGCITNVYTADMDGRFRIEKDYSDSVDTWVIYITTPLLLEADRPIEPPRSYSPAEGKKVQLKPAENDLGDVLVQIRYGLIRLRLPEAVHKAATDDNDQSPILWLKVSDSKGDVMGDGGTPLIAFNKHDLTLSVALPEGPWQIRVSIDKLDGWYGPDKPVDIAYDQAVTDYKLIPAGNDSHPDVPDASNIDSAEAAQEALNKLGIPYSADAFIERIKRDNLHLVRLFLRAGMNPNAKGSDGEPALVVAIEREAPGIVEMLLDKGADPNTTYGEPALLFAVVPSYLDIMRLLLSKGANVDARGKSGHTALMYPSQSDGQEVVDLLLGAGAHINAIDDEGRSALMYAINRGADDAAFALIQRGADIQAADKRGQTNLMTAAYFGRAEIVAVLLDKGARVNAADSRGRTALMYAVSKENEELIDPLKKAGAVETPNIALLHAALSGDTAAVATLLQKGADPNASYPFDETPLMAASEKGHTAIVKALLAKGTAVNINSENDGMTALMKAAQGGHLEIVQNLIKKGAKLNDQDQDGKTALMYAAEEHAEVVKYLLDKHADAQIKDKEGWSVLEYARFHRQSDIVELLHKRGIKE